MGMTGARRNEAEIALLEGYLSEAGAGWIGLCGPSGVGRRTLLTRVLEGHPEAIVLRGAPLSDEDLLGDFTALLERSLGGVPRPSGPGWLPEPGGRASWTQLLLGLADRSAERGRTILLVLEEWDLFVRVRRSLAVELAEALDRAGRRGGRLRVVLTYRAGLEERRGEVPGSEVLPAPVGIVRLGHLPPREAGWLQGAGEPEDAFFRWALLGGRADQLPGPGREGQSWEEAVVERVLRRGGDLNDRPLRRLEGAFQRPERYGALLRALALGPMSWSELVASTGGVEGGGQIAPYLRRLEEEGWVTAVSPLGASSRSRNRRYRLTDPFDAFWYACVLPVRHELLHRDPRRLWDERVKPTLDAHLDRWLPVAVASWFRAHAGELFRAEGREVGGLWGEAGDFPVVAWLTNGQICYVHTRWRPGGSGEEEFEALEEAIRATRYGIGREARTPVLATSGEVGPALRSRVRGHTLAQLLGPAELMGTGPVADG